MRTNLQLNLAKSINLVGWSFSLFQIFLHIPTLILLLQTYLGSRLCGDIGNRLPDHQIANTEKGNSCSYHPLSLNASDSGPPCVFGGDTQRTHNLHPRGANLEPCYCCANHCTTITTPKHSLPRMGSELLVGTD